ncbi:hypothetical protein PXK56_18310 [Phaeobacter gallaeciensis]|uniref:DUF7831 domain-containing protein n=1 Tax=Phaeobacter gallaeciensis TaxID=60890 RepID=UPI002380878B|nr:hypothetical protein [Phaeobacter gallaeciensis]MDE4297141.1 hypothetical protein [Phaeobacter gallaeciensis]
MPLIYQFRIYRQDLQRNPGVLYVFGDNVKRVGLGGQAAEMRGEPNAVGVATKWEPSSERPACFFSDTNIDQQKQIISKDLAPVLKALKEGKTVIWPLDGIGSGLSEVPTRAPQTWAWMEGVRKGLEKL